MYRSLMFFALKAPLACALLLDGLIGSAAAHHEDARGGMCSLRIELVDAKTKKAIPGLIQIRDREGKRLHAEALLDRGLGLPANVSIHDWTVLPRPTVVKLPQRKLTVRAFSGLETESVAAGTSAPNWM